MTRIKFYPILPLAKAQIFRNIKNTYNLIAEVDDMMINSYLLLIHRKALKNFRPKEKHSLNPKYSGPNLMSCSSELNNIPFTDISL